MAEPSHEIPGPGGEEDGFFLLMLRYFDGDLTDDELEQFNDRLRREEKCRQRLVEFSARAWLIRETFEPERQAQMRHEPNAVCAVSPRCSTPSTQDHSGPARGRRRVRTLAIAAGVLVAAALIAGWFLWPPATEESRPIIGLLERTAGEVHVLAAVGEVREVQASAEVRAGDTIRVRGQVSEAVLVLADGTKLQLVGDTSITCGGSTSVVIQHGTLSVLAKEQRQGHPLVFTTSAAQIEVLGTQFLIEARGDEMDLSVLEGRVRVTRVSDGQAVEVQEGKRLIADERDKLVVEDIQSPPSAWELDFEAGLPKDFVRGQFVKDGLPAGSKGAVAAIRADLGKYGIVYEVATPKAWSHGLFAVHDDSHFHFTYKMDRPDWLNVFIIARGPDPYGPHSGNYLFAEPIVQGPPGKWRTLTIPLTAFRRAGYGKGPPLAASEIPFRVLFSSDADRGLVIDRVWVKRGGPGIVQLQDVP